MVLTQKRHAERASLYYDLTIVQPWSNHFVASLIYRFFKPRRTQRTRRKPYGLGLVLVDSLLSSEI